MVRLRLFAGLKSLIGFLTVLPVHPRGEDLELAAKYMPLFPVVGLGIGVLAGLFAWTFRQIFPSIMAGLLGLGVILWITGLHHTDGLLDFGDGVMLKGTKDEKIQAMHDKNTGAGGYALGLIVMLATALAMSFFKPADLILIVASAETTAKTCMVLICALGKSATKGLNTPFVEAMRKSPRVSRLLFPISITLVTVYLTSELIGLLAMGVAVIFSLMILGVANRQFGGITGDVLGAANDIARMVYMLSFVSILG